MEILYFNDSFKNYLIKGLNPLLFLINQTKTIQKLHDFEKHLVLDILLFLIPIKSLIIAA